jgi:uncharacterized SAM-binding protein YcdF (DUF218 family)
MTTRRLRRSLLLVMLGVLALTVANVVTLRALGPWLVVNDPLVRSDVIFVTDGKTPQRELEGAALYLEGWAPRVALTLARDQASEEVRALAGELPPQEYAARLLRRRGVPESAIVRLDRLVENTVEELDADFQYARDHGFRRVIIVSSPYHTRRIHTIWRARFADRIPALIRVTRYERVEPARWWRSRHSLEDVVHEVFGISNFLLGSPIPTFDRKK